MGLIEVRAAIWCGTIFVNLSGEAVPFEDFIRPLASHWKSLDLSLLRPILMHSSTMETNWKLAIENGLDRYHLPWVHPVLGAQNDTLQGGTFNYLSEDICGYTMSDYYHPESGAGSVVGERFPDLEEKLKNAFDLEFVFPNTFLLMSPMWVQVVSTHPRGVRQSEQMLFSFMIGEEMMSEQWADHRREFNTMSVAVSDQDIPIMERQMKGRATSATNLSVYSMYWDQVGEYFAGMIRRAVGTI